MPRHDPVQACPQRVPVQVAAQSQCRRDVIRRTRDMVQLIQEPQALLSPRQRQGFIAVHRNDRILRGRRCPGHGPRQHRQSRLREHVAQCDFHSQHRPQAGHQLHGQQRVPAQLQKIIMATDALQAQQFLPDSSDDLLDPAHRRFVFAARHCQIVRCR